MAYLTKDQYNYRASAAAERMIENATNENLTERQHELLATICAKRHVFHCVDARDLYYETRDYEYALNLIMPDSGEDTFISLIESTGITGKVVDEILDELAQCDREVSYMDTVSLHEDEDKTEYDVIMDYGRLIERVNTLVERFLGYVDDTCNTNYKPTGALRI